MGKSVLVTSAESKQTLAVLRALAKEGYDVSTVGSSRFSQAFYSKYCSAEYIVADPAENPDDYLAGIKSILSRAEFDVLLPVKAVDTMIISRHKNEFPDVAVATDSFENIKIAHDKEKAIEHAKEQNVPVPKTFCPTNDEELHQAATNIEYPAVVKLRKTSASIGLRYVHSQQELLSTYSIEGQDGVAVDYSRPLIQEYIPGDIHDVCVLFKNGKIQKALTQKRLWMFPVSGGAGAINVTTDRPDLVSQVKKLLSPLNYHGVAQVEFMDGKQTEEPRLIEINPKIWGTIELSIEAGMNFPHYHVEMALGNNIQGGINDYEQDLSFIWYDGEFLGHLYKSEDIIKKLKDIQNIRESKCKSNLSKNDPIPHIIRTPQLFKMGIERLYKE